VDDASKSKFLDKQFAIKPLDALCFSPQKVEDWERKKSGKNLVFLNVSPFLITPLSEATNNSKI